MFLKLFSNPFPPLPPKCMVLVSTGLAMSINFTHVRLGLSKPIFQNGGISMCKEKMIFLLGILSRIRKFDLVYLSFL